MPTKTKPTHKTARPSLGEVAEAVAGTMMVNAAIDPMGYAISRDSEGRPLYLVAVVMGPENIQGMARALDKMRDKFAPVPEIAADDDPS